MQCHWNCTNPFHTTWVEGKLSCECVLVAQSCLTLCDPMDYSPPVSSVHGIFQARILEWVAISYSRGSSQHRDGIRVSCTSGRFFTVSATREASYSYDPALLLPGIYSKVLIRNTHHQYYLVQGWMVGEGGSGPLCLTIGKRISYYATAIGQNVLSGFSMGCYRKTQTNFWPTPVHS